jgi:predicted GTPase
MHELETTLNSMPADLVLSATPIDLTRVLKLKKPVVRVRYELEEMEPEPGQKAQPRLVELMRGIVEKARAGSMPATRR